MCGKLMIEAGRLSNGETTQVPGLFFSGIRRPIRQNQVNRIVDSEWLGGIGDEADGLSGFEDRIIMGRRLQVGSQRDGAPVVRCFGDTLRHRLLLTTAKQHRNRTKRQQMSIHQSFPGLIPFRKHSSNHTSRQLRPLCLFPEFIE